MAATKTPAARARERIRAGNVATSRPPRPPEHDRRQALLDLTINIHGREYLIGPAVEGDPDTGAQMDGTATITMNVRDGDGTLQDALANEAQILKDGVTITVDRIVYTLQSVAVDEETGTLVTLTFHDQVKWRFGQFSSFLRVSRDNSNRAQFIARLVEEASRPPLAPMPFFCPEINDKQRIAKPDTKVSTKKGTGADSAYKVKRVKATAEQRDNIDAILTEADDEGSSRRVMIATIMAATQESVMRTSATNGKHLGLYNQDPGWGSVSDRRDATRSTRAFLAAWKKAHGSLKNAPGDLAAGIEAVQRSGQGSLYSQWETEATATVDAWLGGAGESRTRIEPFEFTRGEKDGEREDSWTAIGRLTQDVEWHYWAQYNTLFVVSDDELRAAAPALEIHGDEEWLLAPPSFDWSPDRVVTQVTLRVLADEWAFQIGANVMLATGGPARGRFLVNDEAGSMVGPELTVTLRRPSTKKPEPAADSASRTGSGGSLDPLLDACRDISRDDHPYSYGGGHGSKLSAIRPKDGLDCSSSCSLALWKADMFDGTAAITSGAFASSWGKPGKGKDFTVWANDSHMWIEFHDGRYKRFDTRGPGESGPHLRESAAHDQARFTARHWPGH